MSAPASIQSPGAVFLSYASQDAAAAQRICDALRAAGVEVWFDQNELVGGDAWDAKIRKQIAECALFVPIISAATQARHEGYFRLEWKLAAQRTHMMSGVRAFLLPVVIDDTRDAEAHVPVEFKEVQWTRLPGGEAAEKFCARVQRLLGGGGVAEVGDPGPASTRPATATPKDRRVPVARWVIAVPAALALVGLIALAVWKPWSAPVAAKLPAAAPAAASPGGPSAEARRLTLKARALIDDDLMAARENFRLAEELGQRAVALAPDDGEAWATLARISGEMIARNYETNARRRELARSQAERAARLAPESVETGLAAAAQLDATGEYPAAEATLRRLLEVANADERVVLAYARALSRSKGPAEAAEFRRTHPAFATRSARMLAAHAASLRTRGNYARAMELVDQAQAIAPSLNGYMTKLLLLVVDYSDLDAAKTFAEKLPPQLALEDLFGALLARVWLRRGEPDRAFALLSRAPQDFFEESRRVEPKGYLVGRALERMGKPVAAESEWNTALAVVERRLATEQNRAEHLRAKAVLLALTQRPAEAERVWRLFLEVADGQRAINKLESNLAHLEILLAANRVDDAIAELLAEKGWDDSPFLASISSLHYDPWFEPLRKDPRVQALIVRAEASRREQLEPAASRPNTVAAQAPEKFVAVLPFVNLSGDPAQEYFSDGFTEEILTALTNERDLRVPGLTSSLSFKGKKLTAQEIARALNVAQVVEGSVRKAGDQVRITVKLTRASDGFSEPLGTFTEKVDDIFALQEKVARAVVEKLTKRTTTARGGAGQTSNHEAYSLLLQGRFAARQESNSGRLRSIEFYRRVVGLEPGYALAWAEMAQSYIRLARFGGLPTVDGMKLARAAAQKALELDADQVIALDAMGWVQRTADWDWRGAQKTFQRALALAPGNAALLADAAILYFNTGRTDEAITLARSAVERDPLNAMAQINLGDLLWNAGRLPESIEELGKGIRLAPEVEEFRTHLAIAFAQLKRFPEAIATAEAEPNAVYRLFGLAYVAGLRGDRAASIKAREELVKKNEASMTGYVAMLYAVEGNRDEAFAWLDRAYRERDSSACWVKTAAVYAVLHGDPRWPELLRKLGLHDEQLK